MAGIIATKPVYGEVVTSPTYGTVFQRYADFSAYLNKPGIVSAQGCEGTNRYFVIVDETGKVIGHGTISPDGTLTPTANSVMNDTIMQTNNTVGTSTGGGSVYYSATERRVYVKNVTQNGTLMATWKLPNSTLSDSKSVIITNAPVTRVDLVLTSGTVFGGSILAMGASINVQKNYGNQPPGWTSPYTTFGPFTEDANITGTIAADDNVVANGLSIFPRSDKKPDLAGWYDVRGFVPKGSTFSIAAVNTRVYPNSNPCGFATYLVAYNASVPPKDEIVVGSYIIKNTETTNWDNYCDIPNTLDNSAAVKKGSRNCTFNTVGCCDIYLSNSLGNSVPPGYWALYDTCVPVNPVEDKCEYTCWTPCRESKCLGEEFVQTRTLISGPLEICFGDNDSLVSRVVTGLYEPSVDVEWLGEGDGIAYNKGGTGIKKGITRGYGVFKYPAVPGCEGKCSYSYSTPQTVATGQDLCSSHTIGINDGTYTSQIVPTGYLPPNPRGYRRGFYAFRSANIFSSTRCRDVDPGDMDQDYRGIQAHPDGDAGYGEFYKIANGSMGCLSFSQGGEKTLYDFFNMSIFCYKKGPGKIRYNITTNPLFSYECGGKTRIGRPGTNTVNCGTETKALNPPAEYYPPRINPDIPLSVTTDKDKVFLTTTFIWNGPGTLTVNNKPSWANIELMSDNKTIIIYGNPPDNVLPGTYTIDFTINNRFGETNNKPVNYNFYIEVKPSESDKEAFKNYREQKLIEIRNTPLN